MANKRVKHAVRVCGKKCLRVRVRECPCVCGVCGCCCRGPGSCQTFSLPLPTSYRRTEAPVVQCVRSGGACEFVGVVKACKGNRESERDSLCTCVHVRYPWMLLQRSRVMSDVPPFASHIKSQNSGSCMSQWRCKKSASCYEGCWTSRFAWMGGSGGGERARACVCPSVRVGGFTANLHIAATGIRQENTGHHAHACSHI